MAFVELEEITKIYSGNGTLAVGIQNVNLKFDKGEFVAITGKSGCGKSTLLNVLSGMDTYEEGELTVNGETTSHFVQTDWELFRQKYISFIFQEYNIIESFTVLENIELALMDIENLKERKKRACELLERVGMTSHKNSKGSKLSGGQKQRTVIARALAKESPIILADEPTGNLDKKSSEDIVDLLGSLAKDRLIIVVTHNFEDIEKYATRHVRMFDGHVESDEKIKNVAQVSAEIDEAVTNMSETNNATEIATEKANVISDKAEVNANEKATEKATVISDESEVKTDEVNTSAISADQSEEKSKFFSKEKFKEKVRSRKKILVDAAQLGFHRFKGRPKLSAFLISIISFSLVLMMLFTSLCSMWTRSVDSGSAGHILAMKGRVALVTQNGTPINSEEIKKLASSLGGEAVVYDLLLDKPRSIYSEGKTKNGRNKLSFNMSFEQVTDPDEGRVPTAVGEYLLYLPHYEKGNYALGNNTWPLINNPYGGGMMDYDYIDLGANSKGLNLNVVGIKYYKDNTKPARVVATREGYDAIASIWQINTTRIILEIKQDKYYGRIQINPDLKDGEMQFFLGDETFAKKRTGSFKIGEKTFSFVDSVYTAPTKPAPVATTLDEGGVSTEKMWVVDDPKAIKNADIFVSQAFVDNYNAVNNMQSSIIFKSEKEASKALTTLRDKGYVAILSTVAANGAEVAMEVKLVKIALAFAWIILFFLLAITVFLVCARTMKTTRTENAIYRSMGISVKTVKTSMHFMMALEATVSLVIMAIFALFIFLTPAAKNFSFLHTGSYILLVASAYLSVWFISRRFNRMLFKQTVKGNLKEDDNK